MFIIFGRKLADLGWRKKLTNGKDLIYIYDAYQNVVCATYIRKVEKVGGQYQNTVIETIPNVSQFWKWSPEEYLKTTHYTR